MFIALDVAATYSIQKHYFWTKKNYLCYANISGASCAADDLSMNSNATKSFTVH